MNQPTADRLADEAAQCLAEWKADASWQDLRDRALTHLTRWPTLLGTPVISCLDLTRDGGPLLEQAARALAIKAAGHILAGRDLPAMLPIAVPVEEAVNAFTAQVDLLRTITDRAGVRLVQHTPTEVLPYRAGCLTHDAYTAAWGEPPARYWLDHDTVTARQEHLLGLYSSAGLTPGSHTITFEPGR